MDDSPWVFAVDLGGAHIEIDKVLVISAKESLLSVLSRLAKLVTTSHRQQGHRCVSLLYNCQISLHYLLVAKKSDVWQMK